MNSASAAMVKESEKSLNHLKKTIEEKRRELDDVIGNLDTKLDDVLAQ